MLIKKIPNIITLARLLLLPVLIYFLSYDTKNYNWYAMFTLIFISFGDLLDGFLARRLNAVTNLGKIIDPTADKLVILVSVIMLCNNKFIHPVVAILILSREIIILTLRAIASSHGLIISAIDIAKHKTFIQIVALSLITVNIKIFNISTLMLGNILLIISIILAWLSLYLYFNKFFKK